MSLDLSLQLCYHIDMSIHIRELLPYGDELGRSGKGPEGNTILVDAVDNDGDVVVVEVDPADAKADRSALRKLAQRAVSGRSTTEKLSVAHNRTPFICGDCGRPRCGHVSIDDEGIRHQYL